MNFAKFLRTLPVAASEQCLPVVTWNKKHSWKQIATITYTLEKKLFGIATFEGLIVV